MKYIREFMVILFVTFLGECAKLLIPLPIPASIYGLVFMLFALISGLLKVEQVKQAGGFLIETMPMMFIPAAVGVIASWEILKPLCGQLVLIILVSTLLVIGISGRVTQWVILRSGSKEGME